MKEKENGQKIADEEVLVPEVSWNICRVRRCHESPHYAVAFHGKGERYALCPRHAEMYSFDPAYKVVEARTDEDPNGLLAEEPTPPGLLDEDES